MAGFRTAYTPSLTFDEYLLKNYELNGEQKNNKIKNSAYEFKPSQHEPALIQILPAIIRNDWRNSSNFNADSFGESVTPLPPLMGKEYSYSSDEKYISRGDNENNKVFVMKSYHANTLTLPPYTLPKAPSKSLGYHAAKMAERYRNKRRNKKRRKIRKKIRKPNRRKNKDHNRKRIPPSVITSQSHVNAPDKRNIGVAIGITSNGIQSPKTFPQNSAEEFYYAHPPFDGVLEFDEHGDSGHYSGHYSSTAYKPTSDYHDSEYPGSYHTPPLSPYDPKDNALLLLSPSGPRMPVISRLANDMSDMVSAHFDPKRQSLSSKVGNSMYNTGRYIVEKIAGGTIDGEMDIFDLLPIIGVIVASALLVSGLFPTALTSFGFNSGSFVLGRKLRLKTGRSETEKSLFGIALNHLEAGMMLMNAIRYEDDACTEKLACRISEVFHRYADDTSSSDWILNTIDTVMPKSFQGSRFSRSFKMVLSNNDTSSCDKECYRCVAV